jgi:hypothetical protein
MVVINLFAPKVAAQIELLFNNSVIRILGKKFTQILVKVAQNSCQDKRMTNYLHQIWKSKIQHQTAFETLSKPCFETSNLDENEKKFA